MDRLKSITCALIGSLVVLVLLGYAPSFAQGGTPAPASTPAAPAKDPFGRETPQGMVSGLVDALASADYERAGRYFESDAIPGSSRWYPISGTELAKTFQQVLDRAGRIITPGELSNDAGGKVDDGLPEDTERFGTVKSPDGELPLLAKRIERDGKSLWVVAAETLRQLPNVERATAIASSTSGSWLSQLPETPAMLGAPVSHWAVLIGATLLSLLIAWALTALLGPLEAFIRRRNGGETRLSRFVETCAGPLRAILAPIFFGIFLQALEVSIVARYRALFLAQLLFWLAVTWLLWRWADAASDVVLGRMSRRGQLTAYSAISFLNRAVKALLAVLFIAALLRAFGVDVTAGLAALGVGGLAIALGAQKLFENLIGSLTLIADRPVRIGDFCRFGTTLGTVEEIGIRSTRIRTLDRTLLTVPNGEFSSLHIENYSRRDRFWFHPVLNLRYETTPEQMRSVLRMLHEALAGHPKLDGGNARVRFIGLSAYSLDVEIFAYINAVDHSDFLVTQEELLLTCMEIVERSGTGFALPSQTFYLRRDGGIRGRIGAQSNASVQCAAE